MLTRVHTRSFLREIEWFIRLIQPCEELSALFFHEGEVRGVNGDVRLLYFFFYAGTKRWRYHVIFLQIASFPRWGYFSLSLSLSSYRNGQVEGNRWSDKLLVNGDKHSKYDHERKEERSRSAVSSHPFFFHCPSFGSHITVRPFFFRLFFFLLVASVVSTETR